MHPVSIASPLDLFTDVFLVELLFSSYAQIEKFDHDRTEEDKQLANRTHTLLFLDKKSVKSKWKDVSEETRNQKLQIH